MRAYQTYTLLGKKYTAEELFKKADRNIEQFNKLASMSDITFDPRNLEEFITVLSDSLLTGKVTYDQSFFEKIAYNFNWKVKFTKMPKEFYANEYYYDVTFSL